MGESPPSNQSFSNTNERHADTSCMLNPTDQTGSDIQVGSQSRMNERIISV